VFSTFIIELQNPVVCLMELGVLVSHIRIQKCGCV